jgi:hypothetical protein
VHIEKVSGADMQTAEVEGVSVATVEIAGKKVVLGTDRDVKAVTNRKGDYNLYFNGSDITAVTLSASLSTTRRRPRTSRSSPAGATGPTSFWSEAKE